MKGDGVKDCAKKNGADLVGIATADRFMQAPKGHGPEDLLPKAKSVVSMAIRLNRSVVKSIPSLDYNSSQVLLNSKLEMLANEVAAFIEDNGYEALPVDPHISDYVRDVEIMQEEPEPKIKMITFSHRHAAVMAGLGEISAASYLVVPKFGPRVRLVSVITTACITPDPMLKNPQRWGIICKPEICGLPCVKVCPARALSGEGSIDHFKCRSYRNPEVYTLEYFKKIAELKDKGLPPIQRAVILNRIWKGRGWGSGYRTCGRCIKVCPIGITPHLS